MAIRIKRRAKKTTTTTTKPPRRPLTKAQREKIRIEMNKPGISYQKFEEFRKKKR